jgi:DnaJ-class molecular chaperone
MKNLLLIVALSYICYQISIISADSFNPYSALELERSATQHEIKKAYKRLVMEW